MPKAILFNEQEILEKAMVLFWRKGYYATSMQDLVDYLGLNRSSIYNTFGGKKALFDEAFKLYRKKGIEMFSSFLEDENRVKESLKIMCQETVKATVSDPENKGCFAANTTLEMVPGDIAIQKELTQYRTEVESIFYNYLLAGVKNGEIPKGKGLKNIACLLYTVVSGIRVVGKIHSDEKQLLSSIDTILSILD